MITVSHILSRLLRSGQRRSAQAEQSIHHLQVQADLSEELHVNVELLRNIYADCSDIIFHEFVIGGRTRAVLIYIDGLINVEEIDRHVLAPLQRDNLDEHSLSNIRRTIPVTSITTVKTPVDAIEAISNGRPVLLVEKEPQGLSFGLSEWEKRAIEEPTSESVLKGPREGFIESIRTNTALLRRKVRSPNLKIRMIRKGNYTRTSIAIAYIDGIASPALVEEVMRRLQPIEIDGILESTYIEELIEDNPFSLFPQMLATERPDVAAAYLLEGCVVLLVDGSPSVRIAPITMYSLLQSPEDYYERYFIGSAIRWLRYLFFAISLLGPSLYVAILTFHQEMIPTPLLLTMARSREQIPFPALIEALLMETMFEALREAGARLPKQIGSAVSIVGALVIGQAAISAGIVSSPMVMVVAITGIASFMSPRFNIGITVRLLRFPMMFLAGFLGFLGVILGIIIILNHLLTLRSFGVPYLSPLAPMRNRDLKDVLIRVPTRMKAEYPHAPADRNHERQSSDLWSDSGNGDDST
jgi:spore germination protein KA